MSASNQLAAFNYAVQPLGNLQIKNITAAYTVSPSDNNFILNCSGATSYTISLPPSSSFPSGFNCVIWNNSTTAAMAVTIDPNGAETIDGRADFILQRGEGTQVICNGINWQTGNKKTMRGYAENWDASDARPIASGTWATAICSGATASNLAAIAFGRSTVASGNQSVAIGSSTSVTSNYSTALGLNSGGAGSQVVTGSGAMALGGSYASGTDSFAAAIGDNTSASGAKGANSIAMGFGAQVSGAGCSMAIGRGSLASGNSSFALGNRASASGTNSMVLCADNGGFGSTASASNSIAIGNLSNSNLAGKIAINNGTRFSVSGDSQQGLFILRIATTDATATVLTSDTAAASNSNQVILPNNSAYAFSGTIIARQQAAGGTASAAWKVEGLIRREANAGTTTLVASTVTAISNVPGWTLALSADTTNGGLAVTATGAAATNIRWVATIQTSEVTYA